MSLLLFIKRAAAAGGRQNIPHEPRGESMPFAPIIACIIPEKTRSCKAPRKAVPKNRGVPRIFPAPFLQLSRAYFAPFLRLHCGLTRVILFMVEEVPFGLFP